MHHIKTSETWKEKEEKRKRKGFWFHIFSLKLTVISDSQPVITKMVLNQISFLFYFKYITFFTFSLFFSLLEFMTNGFQGQKVHTHFFYISWSATHYEFLQTRCRPPSKFMMLLLLLVLLLLHSFINNISRKKEEKIIINHHVLREFCKVRRQFMAPNWVGTKSYYVISPYTTKWLTPLSSFEGENLFRELLLSIPEFLLIKL